MLLFILTFLLVNDVSFEFKMPFTTWVVVVVRVWNQETLFLNSISEATASARHFNLMSLSKRSFLSFLERLRIFCNSWQPFLLLCDNRAIILFKSNARQRDGCWQRHALILINVRYHVFLQLHNEIQWNWLRLLGSQQNEQQGMSLLLHSPLMISLLSLWSWSGDRKRRSIKEERHQA